ncbi:hypothetical protein ABIE09_002246 [Lysobacter enzymogenes]|uniref:hypothetical protein n=1 Tax=Lysobacter enzymogenes TaxID=69 RepID=UPI0033984FC8
MDETVSPWYACYSLFKDIQNFEGDGLYRTVLVPWLHGHPQLAHWLRQLAADGPDPAPFADPDPLWTLYALSRVNDLLLSGFQPRGEHLLARERPYALSKDDYLDFMTALGLRQVLWPDFSPFHHEIVAVEQAAAAARAPVVLRERWPCLMLGNLLFSRAGVDVSAGAGHVRADLAERAHLYWSYRRFNRCAHDLSHGWGSNSQWRTDFRRDFHIGDEFRFNVDGGVDLDAIEDDVLDEEYGTTRRERIEMVLHRMWVVTDKPDDDLFPYDDRFVCGVDFQLAPTYRLALP